MTRRLYKKVNYEALNTQRIYWRLLTLS
jgi:hypothetical protein